MMIQILPSVLKLTPDMYKNMWIKPAAGTLVLEVEIRLLVCDKKKRTFKWLKNNKKKFLSPAQGTYIWHIDLGRLRSLGSKLATSGSAFT